MPLLLEEHEAWAGLLVSDAANGSVTVFTQIDRPIRVDSGISGVAKYVGKT